jgi:hypothetical protein
LSPKVAVAVGAIIIFAAGIAAAKVIDAGSEDAAPTKKSAVTEPNKELEFRGSEHSTQLPPASAGRQEPTSGAVLKPGADASWAEFSNSLSGGAGIAVAPLGGDSNPEVLGSLPSGHAWSSIKVPIVAALLREEGEHLDGEEEAAARAALTASDNEAAAQLFARLEAKDGGQEAASLAVGEVLNERSGEQTIVSTAPPPPGAVSSYGQTDWSLAAAAEFMASLGAGCVLGPEGTGQVLALMQEVIPEQRWGLGEGGFPAGWQVAFKAGWGPEGSASGPYLVRQNGILIDGNRGVAVAMIVLDESGSFAAGAQDLTSIAGWLRENLATPLPESQGCQ